MTKGTGSEGRLGKSGAKGDSPVELNAKTPWLPHELVSIIQEKTKYETYINRERPIMTCRPM